MRRIYRRGKRYDVDGRYTTIVDVEIDVGTIEWFRDLGIKKDG